MTRVSSPSTGYGLRGLLLALGVAGCVEVPGAEGGPCTEHALCRPGLMCEDGECRPETPGTVGGVGALCQADRECADGLDCVYGMCTRKCRDRGCPDERLTCVVIDGGVAMCLKRCDGGCGAGSRCQGLQGSNGSVCAPELAIDGDSGGSPPPILSDPADPIPAGLGEPCRHDSECGAGLDCLGIVDRVGFCTRRCGGALGCPGDLPCVRFDGGLAQCHLRCASGCAQGQVCDVTDRGERICVPGGFAATVNPDSIGTACASFPDCEGDLNCFSDLPDGYCSYRCGARGCPPGTECVRVDHINEAYGSICMRTCDGGCRPGYACTPLEGSSGRVCAPE